MATRAVGAGPTWGPLSGGRALNLETTLDEVAQDKEQPLGALPELRSALPSIRAHAELGSLANVGLVEDLLLRTVRACDGAVRRKLVEHLPGSRRPSPGRLDDLQRVVPDVLRLLVSCLSERRIRLGADQRIELNDIVVEDESLRGQGLGSAVLEELCGFADHQRWRIIADLVPSATASPSTVQTIAYWYYRYGFRCGTVKPSDWVLGSHMSRAPQS